jgi:hypothetical protein
MKTLPALLSIALLLAASGSATAPESPPRVAVLTIDLNNIHKTDPDSSLAGRIARLGDALRTRLASCGLEVVGVNPRVEAEAHVSEGYFYDHPDVAAAIARDAGADWVVIPRLNRATAWASDLQAHVVRVSDTALVSNRIVELKGLELTPELAVRLTERGAAWMADQLTQAIEHARNPRGAAARPCPP